MQQLRNIFEVSHIISSHIRAMEKYIWMKK
ncbi:MAG: hypothetical protein JWM78_3495 [Verrucomicrobiaceae bacterium]|nr:hypothetical protein [Verrucomicrobiaceae bacterium]